MSYQAVQTRRFARQYNLPNQQIDILVKNGVPWPVEQIVDVLIDNFKMCHEIELKHRLSHSGSTISSEDLLLTKLQIVSMTEKDLVDLIAMLIDQEFDGGYISDLLSNELLSFLKSFLLPILPSLFCSKDIRG